MRNVGVLSVLWLVVAAPSLAAEVPEALRVDGAPIDPFCFQRAEAVVAVTGCLDADMTVKEPQPDFADGADAADGWVERVYAYADMEPDLLGSEAYAAYRAVGEVPAGLVVETRSSGGGTGQFSSVMIVRREGDSLVTVDVPFGGDRCNGGIDSVTVEDGQVAASVNITPYDLLAIAYGAEPPAEAYDDIVACAVCCIGTAAWRDATPVSVTLGMDGEPTQPFAEPDAMPLQGCLDSLLAARGAHEHPVTLDRAALEALAADFGALCLGGR